MPAETDRVCPRISIQIQAHFRPDKETKGALSWKGWGIFSSRVFHAGCMLVCSCLESHSCADEEVEICDETISTTLAYQNLDSLSSLSASTPSTSPGTIHGAKPNKRNASPAEKSRLRNNSSSGGLTNMSVSATKNNSQSDVLFGSGSLAEIWSQVSDDTDATCEAFSARREAALLRHYCQVIAPWVSFRTSM